MLQCKILKVMQIQWASTSQSKIPVCESNNMMLISFPLTRRKRFLLKVYEYTSIFSASFTKGNNFCEFLFAPFGDKKTLPNRSLLLTLLHLERPKLYGVLTVLSAIRLKERICFYSSKFFSVRVDPH